MASQVSTEQLDVSVPKGGVAIGSVEWLHPLQDSQDSQDKTI